MYPIAKLKKLAGGAARGTWQRHKSGHVYAGNEKVAECPPCQGHRGERNAKFIAAVNPVTVLQMIERIEQLEQDLLDQRYKHQRVCKAAGDLVDLVEWHAFLGAESQLRLSVVKQTLSEFGPDIDEVKALRDFIGGYEEPSAK